MNVGRGHPHPSSTQNKFKKEGPHQINLKTKKWEMGTGEMGTGTIYFNNLWSNLIESAQVAHSISAMVSSF